MVASSDEKHKLSLSERTFKEVRCQQLADFNFLFISCRITLKQLQIFS